MFEKIFPDLTEILIRFSKLILHNASASILHNKPHTIFSNDIEQY